MTCVYCEPKSRMTMRETAPGAGELVADTGILADDGISRTVRLGEGALPGHSTLKFLGGIRLRGIRCDIGFATAQQDARTGEHDRGKDDFHARCK